MVDITQMVVEFVINTFIALVILFIGHFVASWVSELVKKICFRRGMDQAVASFTANLVNWGILIFVVIAALGQIGVQTASFVAILAATGLGIGLALQGSLSNFASGVLLLIFKPFKIGDFIEAAGTSGTVENIQIFTTELTSPDNKQVIVPNSIVTSGVITNFSAKDNRRVDLTMGIAYEDDIDKARAVILDEVSKNEWVLKDPEPVVVLAELGDSSVNFSVRSWSKSANYWDVYFGLNEAIKKRFDVEKISIPFPQQEVHMHEVKKAK